MKLLEGLTGLTSSRKGTYVLYLTTISFIALMHGVLTAVAFATIISIIGSAWLASHTAQQMSNNGTPEVKPADVVKEVGQTVIDNV